MFCRPEYRPPIGSLRASLRQRGKEYLRENTLHGVPYFVDPSRPMWERIVWFVCTLASLAAALGIIVTLWEKFQTEPTMTSLDTQIDGIPIRFPNVFLCFDRDHFVRTNLTEAQWEHYRRIYDWDWKSLNSIGGGDSPAGSYIDVLKRLSPPCGDFYSNCSYGGKDRPCKDLFENVITTAGACCVFTEGVIDVFDHEPTLKFVPSQFPISSYLTSATRPLRTRLPFHSFTMHNLVSFSVKETYTTTGAKILSRSQRKCVFEDEGLSFDECIMDCQARKMRSLCRCLPWFYVTPDERECRSEDHSCLAENADRILEESCRCQLPCHNTVYDKDGVQRKISKDIVEHSAFWMFNKPLARYKREVRFGWIDLLVSFGGVAGLFLGYSLLTSVELVYYFTLRLYCGAVLSMPRRRHNIMRVNVQNVKPHAKTISDGYPFHDYVT